MKLVTWNCNGALRNKFEHLSALDADVCIIQECEDPVRSSHPAYMAWAQNHIWIGDTKNKGLGIFGANHIKIQPLTWSNTYQDHTVKHFLPCRINDKFDVLGIWTHQNNSPNFGYIGQMWKYLQVNKQYLRNVLIAGDFNSNSIWDQWDRWWNHTDVVNELEALDIKSLYHLYYNEAQGKESIPTFFFHRKPERPYHIDYVFGSQNFTDGLTKVEVGCVDQWLKLSDHLPVSCEFELN